MLVVRGLRAVLLRLAAVAGLYFAYVAGLDLLGSTDALGAGLLFFLVVAIVVLVWAALDGRRRGFVGPAVVWTLVTPMSALVVTLSHEEITSWRTVVEGVAFFATLWLPLAVTGSAIGAISRRLDRGRRPSAVTVGDRPTT